jgi:hypothetical protein
MASSPPPTTPAQAAAAFLGYVANINADRAAYKNWCGGTPTGGPNGDGNYPLTDFTGNTILVACPAKLAAIGGNITAMMAALAEAEQSEVVTEQVEVIFTPSAGAVPVRGSPFMFASRRTVDLQPVLDAQISDLVQITRLGSDKQLSLGAITKLLNNNYINLLSPPYNVKPDMREVRDATSTAGTPYIDSPSAGFTSDDVGKTIVLSSAANTGGGPLASTIIACISATRVQMAVNSTNSATARCYWGTDNTVGVRQAMADAESVGIYQMGTTIVVPAGGIMTRPFRQHARTTLFGYGDRQSFFYRLPALSGGTGLDAKAGVSFFRNYVQFNNTTGDNGKFYPFGDDFIALVNVGFQGGFFGQPGGDPGVTVEFLSTLGDEALAQADPYWRMINVSVWESPGDGIHTYGRSSSNFGFINVENCNNRGYHVESFDDNVNTIVVIANGQAGLHLDGNGGANGNFTTVKASFNGTAGSSNRINVNVLIEGEGFTLTGCRFQESLNSNLTICGQRNQINGVSIEDTGCIQPKHGGGPSTATVRAGILFANINNAGNNEYAYGNQLYNVVIGPSVHSGDAAAQYGSHGIYFQGSATSSINAPQYNVIEARMTTPFGQINGATGAITPWSFENWGAGTGKTGKDAFSSYNANNVTMDGVLVAD